MIFKNLQIFVPFCSLAEEPALRSTPKKFDVYGNHICHYTYEKILVVERYL